MSFSTDGPEDDDLLARREVAGCVQHTLAPMACAALECSGASGVVGLEEVLPLAGDVHAEAVGRAARLAMVDQPRCRRLPWSRRARSDGLQAPSSSCSTVKRVHADPVGEPGGVGDLVEAVDVHRLAARHDAERLGRGRKSRLSAPSQTSVGSSGRGAQETWLGSFLLGSRMTRDRDGSEVRVPPERSPQREARVDRGAGAGGEREGEAGEARC